MRRTITAVLATALVVGIVPAIISAPAQAYSWNNGQYTSLDTAARLLDTRTTLGRPLRSGETYNLKVTGRGGIATTGVSAVVLNVTVTQPKSNGYLTAWPAGQSVPGTSSINFKAGETRANLVTVAVGTGGAVSIRNGSTSAHVVVDVQGFYWNGAVSPASLSNDYFPITPKRLFDTRQSAALSPGQTITQPLYFGEEHIVSALAVNVTVVRPGANGFVTAWSGGYLDEPRTSNLNFKAGKTTTNMAIVPTGFNTDSGFFQDQFAVTNNSPGSANVIVDLVGYYDALDDGYQFRSIGAPKRIVDTRLGRGTSKLGAGSTRSVTAPSTVLSSRTGALTANVTATNVSANTVLTLWAGRARSPRVEQPQPRAEPDRGQHGHRRPEQHEGVRSAQRCWHRRCDRRRHGALRSERVRRVEHQGHHPDHRSVDPRLTRQHGARVAAHERRQHG